jgi:hypothetical protein
MVKAAARGVEGLVTVLLSLASPPEDCVWAKTSRTYEGSFRCWRRAPDEKWKMVLGINVSGQRRQTPEGQLDIWLPVQSIATVTGAPVEEVRGALSKLPVYAKENVDWIARLKSKIEAETVVSVLADFFTKHPGYYAGEVGPAEPPLGQS